MTYEEYKNLRNLCIRGFENVLDENEHFIKDVELALKKQIPSKPLRYPTKNSYIEDGVIMGEMQYLCRNCRKQLSEAWEYCPKCSQKIGWHIKGVDITPFPVECIKGYEK